MNDDPYCLFIICASMITLVVPDTGHVVVAVFAFALAVLAQLCPCRSDAANPTAMIGPASSDDNDRDYR